MLNSLLGELLYTAWYILLFETAECGQPEQGHVCVQPEALLGVENTMDGNGVYHVRYRHADHVGPDNVPMSVSLFKEGSTSQPTASCGTNTALVQPGRLEHAEFIANQRGSSTEKLPAPLDRRCHRIV